jgi:osmoprotectant transport system permease protein
MTAVIPDQSKRTPLAEKLDLIVTPVFAVLLALLGLAVWLYSDLDATTRDILSSDRILRQAQQTIILGLASSALVVTIAVPIGILVTRRGVPRLKNFLVDFLGLAQALPAYGLIVIFFTWMGAGLGTVVYALATFSLLPVLRNTIVGLEQVDKAVIEAGRGMGYTRFQVLLKIELPLAIPVIIAGVRTAIVINIGMAALAFLIGGGGLGETINSGLKLNRPAAIFLGAVMIAILAIIFDFLSALAQRHLKPKGL